MRRVVGVLIFLVGLGLFIWGMLFRQWPLVVPGISEAEDALKISEMRLNVLLSREALLQTAEGEFSLKPKVVQRLPSERPATAADVEDAAEESDGVCET